MSSVYAMPFSRPMSILCEACGHQDNRHKLLEASVGPAGDIQHKVQCGGNWRNNLCSCIEFVLKERDW